MTAMRRVRIIAAGALAILCVAPGARAEDPVDHTNQDGQQPTRRTRSDHGASNDGAGAGDPLHGLPRSNLVPRRVSARLERQVAVDGNELIAPSGVTPFSQITRPPQSAAAHERPGRSAPIPEPGAAVLLLSGAALLLRRRRQVPGGSSLRGFPPARE